MSIERNYIHRELSPSTNGELKEIIKNADIGIFSVIYADRQSSGRGRLGRSFFSPKGGLYFSASYPLNKCMKNISFLTLLSGIAVNRAISELYGVKTQIKWPNDIYLNSKKLCGILTELVSDGDKLTAVVGIGINVSMKEEDIPSELKDKMTSLSMNGISCTDRVGLMKRTVELLDEYVYEKDCLNIIGKEITDFLNSVSLLRNKAVTYNGKPGICRDINPDGSITVEFENGTENIFFGEILFNS